MSKFHAKDGWMFSRDKETGTVIIHREIPHATQPELNSHRVELDADTWGSIVAHVSADGDNASTFAKARALHDGRE